jgi:YggT family protein
MGNYYSTGILNFVRTLFELYLALLLVRLLLDWFSGKLFNPVYRFIYKFTQPLINITQKFLPIRGNINWSCLGWVIVLELIQISLLFYFTMNHLPSFIGLVIWTVADVLSLLKNIFFWSIIVFAVLSWVSAVNRNYNPLQEITGVLVAPLLRPIQKVLPTLGGFDLSPIVALLSLQVINFLVIVPLLSLGQGLAL